MTPDGLFDRAGDELLDCLRRRVLVLGLDREGGVGEVREQVDREALHREQTEGGHGEGGHEHGDRTVDGETRQHGQAAGTGFRREIGCAAHQPACSSALRSFGSSSMTRTLAPSDRAGAPDDHDLVSGREHDFRVHRVVDLDVVPALESEHHLDLLDEVVVGQTDRGATDGPRRPGPTATRRAHRGGCR